ncbi:hypothetical protein LMG8526HA_01392 [Lactococcus lactis]|nr:hypothetical protein LMG8526_0899 [Lactococcus lactis subsp. lactis]MDU0400508.1 hypothetical protein [Lactococcus lactis]
MVQEPMVKIKKKRKVLIIMFSVCFTVILSLVVLFQGWVNLGKYSVYYAQHLSHKAGTNPVMVAVFNNMEYIYLPNEQSYAAAGIRKIKNNNKDEIYFQAEDIRDPGNITIWAGEKLKLYFYKGGWGYILSDFNGPKYNFASNGKFISVTPATETAPETIKPTPQDTIVVNEQLNEMYGQIVAHRQVPKINLQWLYNLLNERKFN